MRTLIWYFKFVFGLIGKTLWLFWIKKTRKGLSPKEMDSEVFAVVSQWAKARIKDSGTTVTVHGQEKIPKDATVLFVSNHQSNFDIAIFLGCIPKEVGFVTKIELSKAPLLNRWMKMTYCIFMDRQDIRQSMETILAGIQYLKEGHSLVIFPEGTRSKSDQMGAWKAGSFKLATKSNVPIVPVTINGSYKIMEANHNRICPSHVEVTIHDPIPTEGLTKKQQNALPELVRTIIVKDLPVSSAI